jgi:diguanylate cyclase (GGDEF)-like protein
MPSTRETGPIDILLVEDNPGDARLAAEALKEGRPRSRIHWAADGAQALEFLGDGGGANGAVRPDLILVDLNLPRMDGRQFLAALKGHPSLRRIPVIVLSSSRSAEDRDACYDLHAACFVGKPADWIGFRDVVRSIQKLWLDRRDEFGADGAATPAPACASGPAKTDPAAVPAQAAATPLDPGAATAGPVPASAGADAPNDRAFPGAIPAAHPPRHFLLIEDHPGDARLVRELLRDAAGGTVRLTHSFRLAEGLRLLAEARFDAVFLDLFLPDSQGLETLLHVRTRAPEAPIITLTGLQDEEVAALALRQGAQDYLVKGRFDGATLLRAASHAIERTRSRLHLQHLAHHDALTGLPNRGLMEDRLRQALEHARRNAQNLAVLFLDIDHFKSINDRFGHAVGDRLLEAAADRLSACVRASDTVARVGGDEFTVLLPDIARLEDVETVCAKILADLRVPFVLGDVQVDVTASIGAGLFPGDGEDAGSLVRAADAAMYAAKEGGRNAYRLASVPDASAPDRETRLRAATGRRRRRQTA